MKMHVSSIMSSNIVKFGKSTIFNLCKIQDRSEQGRVIKELIRQTRWNDKQNDNKVIGLDVGTRYVGVGISDSERKIAFALNGYERERGCGRGRGRDNMKGDVQALQSMLSEESNQIGMGVIGIPKQWITDKTDVKLEQFISMYGISVLKLLNIPIITLYDESYSSHIARQYLYNMKTIKQLNQFKNNKQKYKIDATSAAIVLQDVLDLINENINDE